MGNEAATAATIAINPAMRLGQVLRRWRRMSEISLRTAAKEIGVTLPTLQRLEAGEMPSAETLLTVWYWLTTKPKHNEHGTWDTHGKGH